MRMGKQPLLRLIERNRDARARAPAELLADSQHQLPATQGSCLESGSSGSCRTTLAKATWSRDQLPCRALPKLQTCEQNKCLAVVKPLGFVMVCYAAIGNQHFNIRVAGQKTASENSLNWYHKLQLILTSMIFCTEEFIHACASQLN